jgi:hypothetical protein
VRGLAKSAGFDAFNVRIVAGASSLNEDAADFNHRGNPTVIPKVVRKKP